MKHILTVEPAIPMALRHSIEDLLKEKGYPVAGAGQMMDGSSCDISFDSPPVKPPGNPSNTLPDEPSCKPGPA